MGKPKPTVTGPSQCCQLFVTQEESYTAERLLMKSWWLVCPVDLKKQKNNTSELQNATERPKLLRTWNKTSDKEASQFLWLPTSEVTFIDCVWVWILFYVSGPVTFWPKRDYSGVLSVCVLLCVRCSDILTSPWLLSAYTVPSYGFILLVGTGYGIQSG